MIYIKIALLCNIMIIIGGLLFAMTKNGLFVVFISVSFLLISVAYCVLHQKKQNSFDVMGRISKAELLTRFKRLGYHSRSVTIKNGHNVVLVLEKNGIKTLIQFRPQEEKVGIRTIEKIISAMDYYSTSKAILITRNPCSADANVLANTNNIEIWNKVVFQEFVTKTSVFLYAKTPTHIYGICPVCLSKLAKHNKTLKCVSYPVCSFVREI